MPGLEQLLAAAPSTAGKNSAEALEKKSGEASSGETFDQAMNQALAPATAKTAGRKTPPQPGKG